MQTADTIQSENPTGHSPVPLWLRLLMIAFVLGLAGMVTSLFLDSRQLDVLESIREDTAVADTAFYQIEKRPIDRITQILTFGEEPIYFARLKKLSVDDTAMRSIGKENSDRYTLYIPDDTALRVGPKGQKLYFIKAETNRYFRLQTYPGAPGMHEVPEEEWMTSAQPANPANE